MVGVKFNQNIKVFNDNVLSSVCLTVETSVGFVCSIQNNFYKCLVSTKSSHILKQSYSWQWAPDTKELMIWDISKKI